MGLDMGLNKVIMVNDEIRKALEGVAGINAKEVERIKESFAYWRKANAIHAWIVENVQGGEDNCGTFYFALEEMEELLDLVNQVLDAPAEIQKEVAKELLPMQDGFFFGNTSYDDEYFVYYLDDLRYTKDVLERAIKEEEANEFSIYFEYWSSW